jgi:uncharacterized protein
MTEGARTDLPAAAPVAPAQRIEAVDILRGFALMGILSMNIYAFALPFPAYSNPLKDGGSGPLDMGTWWFTHLFSEMKFMSIFSMLFGAGLALMLERAEARGGKFGKIYYRRILWLLLFGLLHGYLMWFGDILYWYAVCGVILYPFRRLRPRSLLPIGAILLCVVVPLGLAFGYGVIPMMQAAAVEAQQLADAGEELTEEQQAAIDGWRNFNPDEQTLVDEIEAYRGGYAGQVVYRAPLVLMFQTVFMLFFGFWRIGGLMLIGMGLLKLGVFSAQRSTRFYVLCCAIGYGVGLPVTFFGARALLAVDFDVMFLNQGGMFPNYFGSIFVAFGHIGLVMLVIRAGLLSWLTRRLAAAGRMALTNYLMQTVICTAIFYGWGLGLFGSLDRFAMMGVVLAVWAFQLTISPPWLERFRFGPAEWLWRSLTYFKRQPMRVAVRTSGLQSPTGSG